MASNVIPMIRRDTPRKAVITIFGEDHEVADDSYFGCCPVCRKPGYYLNIESCHWLVCDKHKTYWYFGCNLFSAWKDEDWDVWERNNAKLLTYTEVEPWYPDSK